MSTTPAQTAAANRLSLPRLIGFSGLGVPVTMLGVILAVFLPRFYASLGMGLATAGFAFTIVRLIDVVFDPFIGVAMDSTRTAIGKYRPWILASAPIIMVSVRRLFVPPAGADSLYLIVWLLILYIGLSMFNLGQAAWAASLATDYDDRSRIYGWMQMVAVAAALVLLLLGQLTGGHIQPAAASSMPDLAWMLIVMIPLFFALCCLITPDRQALNAPPKVKFNWNDYRLAIGRPDMLRIILADLFLTLGPGLTGPIYIFFFHDVKHFPVAVITLLLIPYVGAGLLGSPFWARVAQRVGKHRLVQIACVAYAITQTILMVIPAAALVPTAVAMFAVGFAASAFAIAIRAMVADIADVVKLEQGRDLTSVLYAMVTTTTKIGSSITSGVTFGILALVGYSAVDGVTNTPSAIFGLSMVYLFAPILLVFVGAAMFFGYKLDAVAHAQVREALEARSFAAAEESIVGR